jgi:hypothetical protein
MLKQIIRIDDKKDQNKSLVYAIFYFDFKELIHENILT